MKFRGRSSVVAEDRHRRDFGCGSGVGLIVAVSRVFWVESRVASHCRRGQILVSLDFSEEFITNVMQTIEDAGSAGVTGSLSLAL